jgi:hypothetical protein
MLLGLARVAAESFISNLPLRCKVYLEMQQHSAVLLWPQRNL